MDRSGFKFFIAIVGFLLIFVSCRQSDSSSDANKDTHKTSDEKVVLTQAQAGLAGLVYGKIEQKVLSGDVDARGKLILPQSAKATISPLIKGVVASIEVMPGQIVKKGQILAWLTHPDFLEIQEQFQASNNMLAYLENDFNRQKKLYDENASSEKKYLQTKADYLNALTKSNVMRLMIEQLGMEPSAIENGKIFDKIPVKTPIDGIVDAILVNLSKSVAEGDQLFVITCRRRLFVELDVFEKDIMKIKKGQRVTFVLTNVENSVFEAEVTSVGGSVQQAGRVVKVLAEFNNTGELLFPGMFVASEIHTGEEAFDALPESAVMNFGTGNPYIYYTTSAPGNSIIEFSKVVITTGFAEDGLVQVAPLRPIPENARIVIEGGYYIQSEEGSGNE